MRDRLNKVFSPDNLLWSIVARGVDIVGLSLAWAFLSLGIVTCGPATAALYYTAVKCIRQKEKRTFLIFWRSFVANLKKGILATLICLPFLALLGLGYGVMRANWSSTLGAVMFVAYDVALLVPAGIVCWLFPLLGRFDNPLKTTFRTAGILTFRHLPSTIVVVLLCVESIVAMIQYWWPVFFAPALCAILASLFFERIFPKYLSEDDAKKMVETSETPTEEGAHEMRKK